MARNERYGSRDLTYSRWHRTIEPQDQNTLPYIDIDGLEYCHVCKEPLALIELAQDVGQGYKATTVLGKLAARANLPAYLVLYRKDSNGNIDRFRMRQIYPQSSSWHILTPDEYIAFLKSLRERHVCAYGGNRYST